MKDEAALAIRRYFNDILPPGYRVEKFDAAIVVLYLTRHTPNSGGSLGERLAVAGQPLGRPLDRPNQTLPKR